MIKRRPWTVTEQRYLVENASFMTAKQLAEALNRNVKAIRVRAFEMGLVLASEKLYTPWLGWEVSAIKATIRNGYEAEDLNTYLTRHTPGAILTRFNREKRK